MSIDTAIFAVLSTIGVSSVYNQDDDRETAYCY
jgi:hypothetical protein